MKLAQRMFTAAAILLFATIAFSFQHRDAIATASFVPPTCGPACRTFGGLTQAQFNRMLAAAPAFQTVSVDTATLKGKMSRIGLFGHAPGTGAAQVNGAAQPMLVQNGAVVAAAVSFGPCQDMGILLGGSQGGNAMLDQVQSRQTCTNYEYTVSVKDGTVQPLPAMEWSDSNCGGNGGTVYATQSVTTQLAQNGAVFSIPGQVANFAVTAGSQSSSQLISSSSDATGFCTVASVPFTDDVYPVVPNNTAVTGVPNVAIPTPFSNGAP